MATQAGIVAASYLTQVQRHVQRRCSLLFISSSPFYLSFRPRDTNGRGCRSSLLLLHEQRLDVACVQDRRRPLAALFGLGTPALSGGGVPRRDRPY